MAVYPAGFEIGILFDCIPSTQDFSGMVIEASILAVAVIGTGSHVSEPKNVVSDDVVTGVFKDSSMLSFGIRPILFKLLGI